MEDTLYLQSYFDDGINGSWAWYTLLDEPPHIKKLILAARRANDKLVAAINNTKFVKENPS
jgi:hypothetical protein